MYRKLIITVTCLVFLTACSGLFPYENHLKKNLLVKTSTDSGSMLTNVKARVDIYAIDNTCKVTYQGSVDLKNKETKIGLSQNSPIYLDFIFSNSSFLGSSKGATGFDVYFKTQRGYDYIAEASYSEGIYNVLLYEQKIGSTKKKELDVNNCKPL